MRAVAADFFIAWIQLYRGISLSAVQHIGSIFIVFYAAARAQQCCQQVARFFAAQEILKIFHCNVWYKKIFKTIKFIKVWIKMMFLL